MKFSEKKLHKIGRIDQIVRNYFSSHPQEKEVQAKALMPLFIKEEVFFKNYKDGLPIRTLLRELDGENKLHLLKHVHAVRNATNRHWYFSRK